MGGDEVELGVPSECSSCSGFFTEIFLSSRLFGDEAEDSRRTIIWRTRL